MPQSMLRLSCPSSTLPRLDPKRQCMRQPSSPASLSKLATGSTSTSAASRAEGVKDSARTSMNRWPSRSKYGGRYRENARGTSWRSSMWSEIDNEDAHVRRVFLRTRADFCECSTPTSPADEQALRLSDARDEWEERTARKLRQERVASETGPVTMRARGSDRGRDMAFKTLPLGPLPSSGQEITGAERRSERGRRREPSDDGCRKKWPVAQGEEGRPGLKGAERRRRVEAPGPSKRIYPLWLAPNERSRGRKGAGVGRKADRSPGALA